jgi:hypothetical protein
MSSVGNAGLNILQLEIQKGSNSIPSCWNMTFLELERTPFVLEKDTVHARIGHPLC